MKQWLNDMVAYIQDNPEGYWFKRKLYGWGWTPARWQGWLVTLGAIALIVAIGIRFERMGSPEAALLTELILPIIGVVVLLIVVCLRTGESPRWQWGVPRKQSRPEQPPHSESELK